MTFYQAISPLQAPFELQLLDDQGRVQYVFNVVCIKTRSATLLEELVKVLTDAGVGVFNTNIFASANAKVPAAGGPFLTVRDTGGPGPLYVHNDLRPKYPRQTAHVHVRSLTRATALAMVYAAYEALVVIRNTELSP